ncbi:MAG: aminodeoxychorismate synthase component I [Rhodocyclaceae bacterium]|nr:aminodeoxychorismate synthase component I [Rhodocyclaceae bacterium]
MTVLTARAADEVQSVLEEAQRQALAGRWAVGCVAYEAAPAFDPALKVWPGTRPGGGALPLAAFAIYEDDDEAPTAAREDAADFACGPWRMSTPQERSVAAIAALRRRIADGDFYQVNLTTRLRADFSGSSRALFAALVEAQPGGYCAHLENAAWEVLSVSPELFFDWRPDGLLTARPMKGTAPRHADAATDAAAARAMQASPKERAENLMIVDLLRNDLARVAVTGTVRVPRLFEAEALPTAWQMTSTVQCTTRPDTGLADIFRALFPCGSVTGAPKVAAMAAIAGLEEAPRGAYCGAIGLIRPGGHATFNVGIRTVVLDRGAGAAECGIGSGIVFDSRPEDEVAEWLVKRRFLLRATAGFELLETLALEDGVYRLKERHLERLAASAAHFGFGFDPARGEAALAELAARQPTGAWRVRLLCDRRGRGRTECSALAPTADNLPVALAAGPIDGDEEFIRHKTTERAAYRRFDPPAGVFDTLLWNTHGEITEFTRGNVVLELAGHLVTPPLACGLLPGVLRAELLARGEIQERTVRLDELPQATGLWFINSVRGWVRTRLA